MVRAGLPIAALAALLSIPACMKRTELIAVRDDGSVRMLLEFEANAPGELRGGDAVPSIAGGWVVIESTEQGDDGETTHRLEAEAIFAPGESLPASWATGFDDDRDLVLRFPTALVVERRGDATLYHFHRRYEPRPWACFVSSREARAECLEAIEDRAAEDLSDAEKHALVGGLLAAETMEDRVLAREAFRTALPDGPQDAWFDVDRALKEVERALDVERITALLAADDDPKRDAALEDERRGRALLVRDAMEAALRAHEPAESVNAFLRAYDRGRRRALEITEGLGDDAFEITLELPGAIVGHNATGVDGRRLVWTFDGRIVRDRAFEIMATSRLDP